MFGIGVSEMMIILVIVLIIFGVGKLPEIGGGMGKAISNFRNATKEQDSKEPDKLDTDKKA
jgi:sec-independent protein translocase protein TatA